MSLQARGSQELLPLRARLFAPGQRLGWIFRDRRQFAIPFMEPPPAPQPVHPQLIAEQQAAQKRFRSVGIMSVLISAGLLALVGLAAAAGAGFWGNVGVGPLLFGAVVLAVPGVVLAAVTAARRAAATRSVERAGRDLVTAYQRQYAAWAERKAAHERADWARVEALDEWGAARTPPGTRRIDVFGGSLHGWEAFLTVYGTSTLADRPVLVADFSRELVCRELVLIASAAGAPVDVQLLPAQLAGSSVLAGLPGKELAEALAESMHPGDSGDDRAQRAIDGRILAEVCAALAEPVSVARVAAALRAAMGERDDSAPLSQTERARIGDGLFTAEYRRQVRADLVRIESYLHPLIGLGQPGGPSEPAYLTCIALQSGAAAARDELLASLVLQWLTHRVTAAAAQVPAVIIAGADELGRRHLERLSDACERRGVLLTLLFRHLREGSVHLLGGGAAGFMRLGNHEEAARAADFIGRQHKFVLSQLTVSLGGDETHTTQASEGTSESDAINVGTAAGWLKGLGPAGIMRSLGQLSGTKRTTSRTWSTAYSRAAGTNWNDAQSSQRVYEYAVEPTALQHLPDYAMLLVTSRPDGGPSLTPVECNPEIVTLPRVSTDPLPDLASPQRSHAVPPGPPAAWSPGAVGSRQPAAIPAWPPAGVPPGYGRPPGNPPPGQAPGPPGQPPGMPPPGMPPASAPHGQRPRY